VGIVVLAMRAALEARGLLKVALGTVLAVLVTASLVDTVEENRATWLLLGMIALAGRLAVDAPEPLAECFPAGSSVGGSAPAPSLACRPAN